MAPTSPISPDSHSGLTLDELSQAFAALGHHAAPGGPPVLSEIPPAVGPKSNAPTAPTAPEFGPREKPVPALRSIVEAVLFTGRPDNLPISSQQIASVVRGISPREIEEQIQDLNVVYGENACPYVIVSENAGFRLTLRPEYAVLRWRIRGKLRSARLSPAAIEVLALVAYNEPISAEQVAKMRGAPSGHVLSYLVRRRLLRIERSATRPRKTTYFTTSRFLELFRLRNLQDLPRSDDLAKQ